MPRFHVKIAGRDYNAMADLVRKYQVNVARHTVESLADGSYRIDAHATGTQIRRLETAGYHVDRYEDADKSGKARQAEIRKIGKGKKSLTEAGVVATAGQYLSVAEVEAALTAVAAPPNDAFTKLLTLPSKTWENRVCHALKIGKGSGNNRPGIYFLGGVHAREWGSCDILINFVQLLTQAYRSNTTITLGTKTYTAAQIQSIVNGKDIYVFPQANPDGRNYSMTKEAMWRKNRRPAPAGHPQSKCVGVDINRNYDFMWDYPKYFDPSAPIVNSQNPCDHDVYIGPSSISEPETKNAVWLFDQFPNIRYFIDIHSYSEDILYNWGDDTNQTTDPTMNFQNAAFNGKRGIATDKTYKEFINAADSTAVIALANNMRDVIKTVRGRTYLVEQSVGLYPTAGTSDDYAFSRHFVDPGKAKIYSYTIEWGSANNPTPFHPSYAEMQVIIREITLALLEFCLKAA
ncbi:MAG TPA: M14 family metallopeptidase [Pyrinomonadaceae bacterium]|jgi:murein tripeptide amidase MpaA|nr:M14 family metallopeptidase [Pyrinomonadaceae bacterium]